MEFPVDQEKFSRIALQAAKQTLTQKMRETERNLVFNEYKDKEGQVINATVVRMDNKQNYFVELGSGEAILPPREQIPGERLLNGNRVKVYLKEVRKTPKGPTILASRADERRQAASAQRREVDRDQRRAGRQRRCAACLAPLGEAAPVGGVGALRGGGARRVDEAACAGDLRLGQRRQGRGLGLGRRWECRHGDIGDGHPATMPRRFAAVKSAPVSPIPGGNRRNLGQGITRMAE